MESGDTRDRAGFLVSKIYEDKVMVIEARGRESNASPSAIGGIIK